MEPTLWVVVRVKPGGVFKGIRWVHVPSRGVLSFITVLTVIINCRCFETLGAGNFAPGLSVWSTGQGFGSGLLHLWSPGVTSTWSLSPEALSHPSPSPAGSSVTTLLTLGSHPVPTGFASPSGCGLGCGAVRQDPASRKVGGILVKPGLLTCSVSLKPLSSSPKQGPPPPVRHPSGPVSLRDPPSVCCVQSSVLVGRGWATVQETRLAGHSS